MEPRTATNPARDRRRQWPAGDRPPPGAASVSEPAQPGLVRNGELGTNRLSCAFMASARRIVRLPGAFTMRNGGVLPEVDIAYETWGALSPARDNVLLLVTGLSPGAHARSSAEDPTPGWWEDVIGPGHAVDTEKFHVVCMNSLGSCHGS